MNIRNSDRYIHCSSEINYDQNGHNNDLEVYFSETKHLLPVYTDLKKYISVHEQSRADKYHFEEDRQTYVCCHALLRLMLSTKLHVQPSEISFVKGRNNKPRLKGNPVYFNISHTRNAFAIAISKTSYVGIDLENVNRNLEFKSMAKAIFNPRERSFISESCDDERNRFFLLWTRKEAFLKAIGLGIITNLKQIAVSEQINLMNKKLLENLSDRSCNDHFIYSGHLADYCFSVSVPKTTVVVLKSINGTNLDTILFR